MKLQVPFIQLPLSYDARRLADEVAAIDESMWMPHPQGFEGNSMLPLVAIDGDPANESFAGAMAPTPALASFPYMQQVLASFGATIGRTRLMRLAGQAEVKRHVDQAYYWAERVRIHVPITTQPTVRFECGEAAVNMQEGECWIFDTWRMHRVINDGPETRIHLVSDSVGGERFWENIGQGRFYPGPQDPAWRPTLVAPDANAPRSFPCESANVPKVMTPWEISSHLGFLFGEASPHPQLRTLQQLSGRFVRQWRSLWAHYGDSDAGRAEYRSAYDAFHAAVKAPAQGVVLNNGTMWVLVLDAMIGKAIVMPAANNPTDDAMHTPRAMGDNG